MQKQQVFKVKGMQRDASMANANGEFAYEILNMRLMPAEDLSGFSLTNEKGTLATGITLRGQVIGQCPTNDSLVVFTKQITSSLEGDTSTDYIYEIWEGQGEDKTETDWDEIKWRSKILYQGNLNFNTAYPIEALFNYETEDIQKVYWTDGINQLRCINIAGKILENNDTQFDSIREIHSLPEVKLETVEGGYFVAGILQYYFTYYNEFSAESPIIYTSPLLYLAHDNRGGNVNDNITTAYKLKISNLDNSNWTYLRVYATQRTSLDAMPEGYIIDDIKIPESGEIEFTDYGLNKVSIAPTDLYFKGGKWVKAGTMTVKDQVLFLGNLNTSSQNNEIVDFFAIKSLFDNLRETDAIDNFFSTKTRKQIPNILEEYNNTYYTHKFQLNNTESITHYKYGEKYRFGIIVMDKYGSWSNPIWIKDEFILIPPEQVDAETLELPCPTLNVRKEIEPGISLWEKLQTLGVVSIKPVVVYPKEEERKVIAQGVVCPTVYNLKDRKKNGPYAQASWFMRPNAPVDLWGIDTSIFGQSSEKSPIVEEENGNIKTWSISHKSDLMTFPNGCVSAIPEAGYYGAASNTLLSNGMTGYDYLYDDFSASELHSKGTKDNWQSQVQTYDTSNKIAKKSTLIEDIDFEDQAKTYEKGNWVEFRHNYALRSKGWSFGAPTSTNNWNIPFFVTSAFFEGGDAQGFNNGMVRGAELDVSRFDMIPPVNRFIEKFVQDKTITISKNSKDFNIDNLFFATTLSPKECHETHKNSHSFSVFVLYKYVSASNKEYVETLDIFQVPDPRGVYGQSPIYYVAPKEYIDIYENQMPGQDNSPNWLSPLKLSLKRSAAPKQLKTDGIFYYIWDVSAFSEITKEKYVNTYMPEISIVLNSDDSNTLYYGSRSITETALGNSSYYVDNSIITLNSPEIECQDKTFNLSNSNFRILGIIPLTATSSDISLQVDSPSTDSDSKGSGLIKREYHNTNIGYNGFKGIVGANAYLTNTESAIYSLVQLSPWQSTGTLGRFKNNLPEFGSKDLLKQKILSNLRYSSSTYFFPENYTYINNSADSANAFILKNTAVGWKPANGCFLQVFNGESAEDIVKLEDLKYNIKSLIYKGNIDSIASLTKGDTVTSIANPIYSFGQNPETNNTQGDVYTRMNYPAAGLYHENNSKYTKLSQGASIKYKSSPHFVVGFKCFDSLWGSAQKVQETLPSWFNINTEGLPSLNNKKVSGINLQHGRLYEDPSVSSLYHQGTIHIDLCNVTGVDSEGNELVDTLPIHTSDDGLEVYNLFRIQESNNDISKIVAPNYGWLWLGEIYRESDPTFGGTSAFALENNSWETAGDSKITELEITLNKQVEKFYNTSITDFDYHEDESQEGSWISYTPSNGRLTFKYEDIYLAGKYEISIYIDRYIINLAQLILNTTITTTQLDDVPVLCLHTARGKNPLPYPCRSNIGISNVDNRKEVLIHFSNEVNLSYTIRILDFPIEVLPISQSSFLQWTIGDTYYQRFDTLKTYAYADNAQNSIIDITSFMVETRVNIDGRYDRNRGQESNLQMSPTNFNLLNDVYSQRDNFFTYRILDDDIQARNHFPQQITWSLSKTAGETVDSWMNITLASVLDLDGTKGELTALKNFNNNIIAFQEKGLSNIMFNSRAQIATSEAVPIQIANTGKVDGQQYFTTDIGCQDKWNIVTTPNGLYFVDYFNKSIYRFNGQLEDISTPNGFRSWCYENLNSTANILGYYDVKNKEIMYYIGNTGFMLDNSICPDWLGFSELTGAFSSFYTYPKAWFANIKDRGLWILSDSIGGISVYAHQMGNYNSLLNPFNNQYGITVIPRQDSNTVKTFNNVEFRADSYNGSSLDNNKTFDTISAETEYQIRTTDTLTYSQYRPSNLKKKFRTWRANIPRVNNNYNRFVNQWAKIGLWKMDPSTEKTILHDLSVWYSG